MLGLLFYLVFAQPGPGTFQWPPTLNVAVVDMWAGGGSGGSSNYPWVGGAGGSSAWVRCLAAQPANLQTTYTVGAGGAGVIPGGIGGLPGGMTSFGNCRVYGGGPGYPAGPGFGGEGGYPGVFDATSPRCQVNADGRPIPIVDGCILDTTNGGQGGASWGSYSYNTTGADAPLGGIGGNNNQCGQPPGSGGAGGGNTTAAGGGLSSGCGAPGRIVIRR